MKKLSIIVVFFFIAVAFAVIGGLLKEEFFFGFKILTPNVDEEEKEASSIIYNLEGFVVKNGDFQLGEKLVNTNLTQIQLITETESSSHQALVVFGLCVATLVVLAVFIIVVNIFLF